MRAYKLTPDAGLDGLVAVQMPDPEPGPGQILINVRATSLNYRDLMIARRSPAAIVPLSDGAGEVAAVGEDVTEFAVGDPVAGCFFSSWNDGEIDPAYTREALGGGAADGMLREQVALAASAAVHLPEHMTYEEGATLPCAALTAWNAMFVTTRLVPGQSVLFLGTGGVSIAGLQFAQIAGLRSIITSSSNEKLARARDLGADVTINYRERDDWERAVREAVKGGVDLTLEVGGAATFPQSMTATRLGGSIVLIGALANEGADPGSAPLVAKNIRATRISVGSRRMFEDMNRALVLRDIHPVIDRVFEFNEALAAYRMLESQAHFGKIVIHV